METTNLPPTPPVSAPTVLRWFKVYAGFLGFIYFVVAASSLFFFFGNPDDLDTSATAAYLVGTLLLLIGLVFFAACLPPLLLTPRPWLWTYDLVIICLGLTSACFLPICIPLLIFWIKPATKQYFGK